MDNNNNNNNGMGVCSVLTIVFIVLKLCKVIDWRWFWVLSPTIIPIGILFILFIFMTM